MPLDTQLLALLCGHFLGDFLLQSDRLVALKSVRGRWLLFHCSEVALITWLLLGSLWAWRVALMVFVVHLVIDWTKIALIARDQSHPRRDDGCDGEGKTADRRLAWFYADQLLHLLSLVLLWWALRRYGGAGFAVNHWEPLFGLGCKKGLILLTGLTTGVLVVSVLLKFQMAEFALKPNGEIRLGLPRGGKVIGILERLLVFMFVLAGKPEGAGFVIAAKSVFRIGDLTRQEDREHAEYIMIGTLYSFTYALAAAFLTKWLMAHC